MHDQRGKSKKSALYGPKDFNFDPQAGTCVCPAGRPLYRNGAHCRINGYAVIKFQGAQRDGVPCSQSSRCLRHPHFFQGKCASEADRLLARMRQAIDSDRGRALYGRRFATVEPVFANIRHNKKLNRFTPRGQAKVDTLWKRYCLVHNIEKLAHHGYAQQERADRDRAQTCRQPRCPVHSRAPQRSQSRGAIGASAGANG